MGISHPAWGTKPTAGATAAVAYDDGDPATVVVAPPRTVTPPRPPGATPGTSGMPRAPVPRPAGTYYDDGDPATIVC